MSERTPGDPLAPHEIRELRERAGLTQDQFAARLGLRGGKGSVSAWELNRRVCDGPAAELILHLFGSPAEKSAVRIRQVAKEAWNRNPRTPQSPSVWREVVVAPRAGGVPPREEVPNLPCLAALRPDQGNDVFPPEFVFPPDVDSAARRIADGWQGMIPNERGDNPWYLWIHLRDGSFLYREPMWEVLNAAGYSRGQPQVSFMLTAVLKTLCYLRIAHQLQNLPAGTTYDASLVAVGMENKGFAWLAHYPLLLSDLPGSRWSEERLKAVIEFSGQRLVEDPVQLSIQLVREMVLRVDPSSSEKVSRELERMLGFDKKERARRFAFLDDLWG